MTEYVISGVCITGISDYEKAVREINSLYETQPGVKTEFFGALKRMASGRFEIAFDAFACALWQAQFQEDGTAAFFIDTDDIVAVMNKRMGPFE